MILKYLYTVNNTQLKIKQISGKKLFLEQNLVKADSNSIMNITGILLNNREQLNKKFQFHKNDDKFSIKNLHKDIIDYQIYIKDQTQGKINSIQNAINKIQSILNDFGGGLYINLYGSYATNLPMPWSDVDLLITSNTGYPDSSVLRNLYTILTKMGWVKWSKLIETTAIPLIKLVIEDNMMSIQIDISLHNSINFGLECVKLVHSFLKEYEALEPLTIACKTILKFSILNDPYKGGLSSYGLILLLVSFLQNQYESKKSISVENDNLGRIFLEFLYHYGTKFDHTKYIVITQIPNNKNLDSNSNSYVTLIFKVEHGI